MMQANGEVLNALRSNIHGELIGPEHVEYAAARRVWNADIDRRPAVIARCESIDDVRTAVLAATEAGFPYAPQTRESGATGGCVPPAGDDKGPSEFRLPGLSSVSAVCSPSMCA
jgi:FAD/FMN-containing dehydrogenase